MKKRHSRGGKSLRSLRSRAICAQSTSSSSYVFTWDAPEVQLRRWNELIRLCEVINSTHEKHYTQESIKWWKSENRQGLFIEFFFLSSEWKFMTSSFCRFLYRHVEKRNLIVNRKFPHSLVDCTKMVFMYQSKPILERFEIERS